MDLYLCCCVYIIYVCSDVKGTCVQSDSNISIFIVCIIIFRFCCFISVDLSVDEGLVLKFVFTECFCAIEGVFYFMCGHFGYQLVSVYGLLAVMESSAT